jgi:hypothetical protein
MSDFVEKATAALEKEAKYLTGGGHSSSSQSVAGQLTAHERIQTLT